MAQPLPPQAYTTEILARAYDWLKHQPSHVQELAKTADALVSLYLKAKRNGFIGKEKQSTESFQSDLKNLSQKMKHFDEFQDIEKRVEHHVQEQLGLAQAAQAMSQTNAHAQAIAQMQAPQAVPQQHSTQMPQSSKNTLNTSEAAATQPTQRSSLQLDPRTMQTLNAVQSAFNLSSPDEALRLLVQVGYSKIRDQLN